ncbi:MAG: iron-containing alcohol dehydrogenase, partial [Micropruina sp.]
VHGFAGGIGGLTGAPHGAICAALLAATCRTNLSALSDLDPAHPALGRYAAAGEFLSGERGTVPLLEWIEETVSLLQVPGLIGLGLPRERFAEACEKAAAASSMKGNPVALDREQLLGILEASA